MENEREHQTTVSLSLGTGICLDLVLLPQTNNHIYHYECSLEWSLIDGVLQCKSLAKAKQKRNVAL